MTEAVRAPRALIPNPLSGLDPRRRQLVILVFIGVVALTYPLIYRFLQSAAPFVPWPGTAVLIFCATFAILALGLNIVMGFAGLLDLGYVAFYAIGAYTTAFLASPHFGVHISWWIVIWIAVAAAAVFGVMLGAPTLKLRGDYLAIVTLGFGEIVRLVFRNLGDITIILPAFLGGAVLVGPNANLTGGNVGINPIDPPIIPIPGPWGPQLVFSNQNAIASWYLVLAVADHHVLHLQAAPRLEARPRVDGHPGGRDRRGSDGHQHGHDEAARVLAGCQLLGVRRRIHRRLQHGDLRRDVQLQRLDPRRDHHHPGRHRLTAWRGLRGVRRDDPRPDAPAVAG